MSESRGPEIAYYAPPPGSAKEQLAHLEDHDLVARTLLGQDLAFELLMDRYMPMILGYLHGKTNSEGDTEDLAQEVFLAAFRNLSRLRSRERFGPWLMRILRSKLIDYYRTNSRRPQIVLEERSPGEEAPSRLQQVADPGLNPARRAASNQTENLVLREIRRLGERYREVLYLRLLGEESTGDIARRLGIREETVRIRMLRGLKKLRQGLLKWGIGPETPSEGGGQ